MIDDMLRQNWSTLHSHSKDLKFRHSAKAARAKPEGATELIIRHLNCEKLTNRRCHTPGRATESRHSRPAEKRQPGNVSHRIANL
jgi:hypothetical protein